MKTLLLLIWSIGLGSVLAQTPDSMSLQYCQQEALAQYPLIRQKALLDQITEEKINTLHTHYLPGVSLNGQATYQSDVTEIPINIPFISIPGVDKDMYKVTLDVQQLIWDGGMIRQQKQLERVTHQADVLSLEAELYTLKDRINQLYFSILLFQQSKKVLESVWDELNQRKAVVSSGVKNGVVMESQLDVLRAEMLKLEQQMLELNISIQSGLEMLGTFLNRDLPPSQVFQIPAFDDGIAGGEHSRLEPLIMEQKQEQLEVGKKLAGIRNLPKISAFGQAGYGKPGLNMLKSEFDSYYIVGARFSWNLWNWEQVKKEKRVMDWQKDMITAQKETFNKNINISLQGLSARQLKYQGMLEKDAEIIILRTRVSKAAASQLENGIITSSDYIRELNQEVVARLNRESNMIQLIKAKADYLTMGGKM